MILASWDYHQMVLLLSFSKKLLWKNKKFYIYISASRLCFPVLVFVISCTPWTLGADTNIASSRYIVKGILMAGLRQMDVLFPMKPDLLEWALIHEISGGLSGQWGKKDKIITQNAHGLVDKVTMTAVASRSRWLVGSLLVSLMVSGSLPLWGHQRVFLCPWLSSAAFSAVRTLIWPTREAVKMIRRSSSHFHNSFTWL